MSYKQTLINMGVPEDEAQRAQDHLDSLDAACNAMMCPKCGLGLSRTVDGRQVGIKDPASSWVQYRCRCGFMLDRAEVLGKKP